jgi:hypothetical protein
LNMAIETFSVGDTVFAEGFLRTKFKIASELKGANVGKFYLNYENGSPVLDQAGARRMFHRSLLAKVNADATKRSES